MNVHMTPDATSILFRDRKRNIDATNRRKGNPTMREHVVVRFKKKIKEGWLLKRNSKVFIAAGEKQI